MKSKHKIHRPNNVYPLKKQFLAIEHFEIYESQGNYIELTEKDIARYRHRNNDQILPDLTARQFIEAIKEELRYQGHTIEELAKSVYIKTERMNDLLQGRTAFRKEEIADIKKKLYID